MMTILQGKLIRPVSVRLRQFSVIVCRVHVCPRLCSLDARARCCSLMPSDENLIFRPVLVKL